MRSYSEMLRATGGFTARDLKLLRVAQVLVEAIPDPPQDAPLLRCHEVARAVGSILGLDVVDGFFGSVDHTWLVIPDEERKPWRFGKILDVYAVGSLPQVQLHDAGSMTIPFAASYRPGPPHPFDNAIVERLVADMRERVVLT